VSGTRRQEAVREATLEAARVPLDVAEACPEIVELCDRARRLGMAASASDAGVGAGMARAAALGAAMNVRINLQGMADDAEAAGLLERADAAVEAARRRASEVEAAVWEALGGPLLSDDVSDL
jgi:glutamate formiminotransferase/formiminotetrahydrofolate cyclodeaminase